MRCKQCDYSLWNLKARSCPECGTAFVPSAYEFVAGTVRFGCPECDQGYYGTDERGHLVPRKFACVQCANVIDMDAMVLVPAEGLTEEQTRVNEHPWIARRKIGRWRGFWRSVGLGIAQPRRLASLVPTTKGARESIEFALLVLLLPMPLGIVAVGVIAAIGGGLFLVGAMAAVGAVFAVALFAYLLAWTGLAHLVLRVSGPVKHSIGRTCAAVGLSAGPMVFTAVPCVGFHLGIVTMIWWSVVVGIVIAGVQRVSAARAATAAAVGPLLVIVAVGGYAGFVYAMAMGSARMTATSTVAVAPWPQAPTLGAPAQASKIAGALREFGLAGDGSGPRHAAELLIAGKLSPPDFIVPGSTRDIDTAPLGPTTLGQFWVTGTDRQKAAVEMAAAAVGPEAPGYWLGDYYICDRGVDYRAVDQDVWVVVGIARQAEGFVSKTLVVVSGKGAKELAFEKWAEELARQNELRAGAGLAELPDVLAR